MEERREKMRGKMSRKRKKERRKKWMQRRVDLSESKNRKQANS